MNQYERIVSYIHQYQDSVKGANAGYAKIEKRGDSCRLQAQIRSPYISMPPCIYLFRQLDRSIRTVYVGEMSVNGNEIYYKGSTEVNRLFGSEWSLEDIDGLLLYLNRKLYFATSWKKDSIILGDWQPDREEKTAFRPEQVEERGAAEVAIAEEPVAAGNIRVVIPEETPEIGSSVGERTLAQERPAGMEEIFWINPGDKEDQQEMELEPREMAEGNSRDGNGTNAALEREEKKQIGREMPMNRKNTGGSMRKTSAVERNAREAGQTMSVDGRDSAGSGVDGDSAQVQMQAICGVCPFKRQNVDYGKRILLSFPTMRPFPDEKSSECVRLELQDIGCLPMKYWSLSGNRFLLHGYYCYRHLIFCQRGQGEYMVGVPGIYSDREQKNACRFGFPEFQSIGGFGRQQGAFGYWLMELI